MCAQGALQSAVWRENGSSRQAMLPVRCCLAALDHLVAYKQRSCTSRCSADVEAELRSHLDTAQRIVRVASLCREHEMLGEAAAGARAGGSLAKLAAASKEAATAQPDPAECVKGGLSSDAEDKGKESSLVANRPAGISRPSSSGSARQRLACSALHPCAAAASEAPCDGVVAVHALEELGLQPGSGAQHLLDAFTRRMNAAVLDSAALEQERLRLSAENASMRAVIKAVQEGTGVSEAAVEGPLSTLLVVNERLQRTLGGAAASRGQAAKATAS